MIDDRRSDSEHGSGIRSDAIIPQFHGIVDDLEKIRVRRPAVEVVKIFPMTPIVRISEASAGREVSEYPIQAKINANIGMPLLPEGVTYTVMTGPIPGIGIHSLQVIHVPPCG